MMNEYEKYLQFTTEIANEAGQIMKKYFQERIFLHTKEIKQL